MKRRLREEQIIGVLKEHEATVPARKLCRKLGLSDASYYKWEAKFRGMELSDARRLRELESENAKLKKLVVNLSLDKMALKDVQKRSEP